jgi:hypothetical protein
MSKQNAESDVFQLIKKMKQEKEEQEKRNRGTEKRFTVVLSEYDYRRLNYISKELGAVRSSLARQLIVQALNDAEKALGLEEWILDDGASYGEDGEVYVLGRYGKYINEISDGTDDDGDEGDEPKGAPRGGPSK